jgi:hypothetical protein
VLPGKSLSGVKVRLDWVAASVKHCRGKWQAYEVYFVGLLIFAASRLVVVLGTFFGKLLVVDPDPAKWNGGQAWYYRLLRWDAGWFLDIVNRGYHYGGSSSKGNVSFLPGYPLIAFVVKSLLDIDALLALLLVANVASLAVSFLMLRPHCSRNGIQRPEPSCSCRPKFVSPFGLREFFCTASRLFLDIGPRQPHTRPL